MIQQASGYIQHWGRRLTFYSQTPCTDEPTATAPETRTRQRCQTLRTALSRAMPTCASPVRTPVPDPNRSMFAQLSPSKWAGLPRGSRRSLRRPSRSGPSRGCTSPNPETKSQSSLSGRGSSAYRASIETRIIRRTTFTQLLRTPYRHARRPRSACLLDNIGWTPVTRKSHPRTSFRPSLHLTGELTSVAAHAIHGVRAVNCSATVRVFRKAHYATCLTYG